MLKDTVNSHPHISINSKNNLIKAEQLWIKHVQSNHFSDIIQFLHHLKGHNLRSLEGKKIFREKKLIIPQLCLNLHLILDNDEIIRVKTSLGNCENLSYDQKCPILLPANDVYTQLVIAHNHVNSGHMSIHHTRS